MNLSIAAGADVDIQDDEGFSALMLSTANGRLEIVDILISAGANLDLQ